MTALRKTVKFPEIFCSGAYSKPSQSSTMKLFAKIVNGWKLLTIFQSLILDISQGSEYISEFSHFVLMFSLWTLIWTGKY